MGLPTRKRSSRPGQKGTRYSAREKRREGGKARRCGKPEARSRADFIREPRRLVRVGFGTAATVLEGAMGGQFAVNLTQARPENKNSPGDARGGEVRR